MRGRSSKQDSKQGMELDRLNKLKEEQPHLSGAYIRSLVKQLTSSRTKDTMNHPKDRSFANDDGCSVQDMTISDTKNQPTQQPQQHKKQVRRRLHTSRPYQERLLNMAEARREIVAALKFHRATMKEQQQQQQQQPQQQQQQPSLPIQLSPSSCFEQEGKIKSRRNPRIYPSNTCNFSNYLDSLSYSSLSPHAPPPPTSPPPYPYYWPNPPILPPENLNFPLPNQTLGLNLNFQDFNNLDTTLYHNPSSVYTSSSSSSSPPSFSSSSPSLSIATEEVAKFQEAGIGMPSMVSDLGETYRGGGLHQVMDDDEMAEIRSLGEQHQMEWSDTMNLVQSAWWFKFLKTMESDPQLKPEDGPFEQVMEFPAWLNANEGCLQQHLDDYCSEDYYHDPTLPCMDIGEIEGMDGEWLA